MQERSCNSKKEILVESTSNQQTDAVCLRYSSGGLSPRDSEDMSSTDYDTDVSDSPHPQDHILPSLAYHHHVYSTNTRGNGNISHRLNMRGVDTYPLTTTSVYTENESHESSPSFREIKQHSKENYTSPRVDSHDFLANSSVNMTIPILEENASHTEETSYPSRIVNAKTGSSSFPTHLPTFHASSLGPWHAVIAYDACVRLCLHAWAKGCMEAPAFLENECALLRTTFGLQQVLLQSEEELLVTRSSEVGSEGVEQKQMKMVGKMKVQVRKVIMTSKPPKVKWETIRHHFAKIQSKISSGWKAVRKIHFTSHRVPADGSLSRHGLQASTQNMKQVSGPLKIGVSTLLSSSTGYEIQGS